MSSALAAPPPSGDALRAEPPRGSWLQPVSTGLLAALVGFASTFTIVLQGLTRVGATPAEAASGLLAICVAQGLLSIGFSLWRRSEAEDRRYFDFHRDLGPAEAARMLGGEVVWQGERNGEWAAVLRFNRAVEAQVVEECGREVAPC